MKQLAANCEWLERTATVVRLRLDERSAGMQTQATVDKLAAALADFYGQPMRIELERVALADDTPARVAERAAADRHARAVEALERDPVVRLFRDRFGATLDPASVKPR